MKNPSTTRRAFGFSLVEVLAAVSIIGIIAFLAVPNIVAIKQDSERNLAISRAEALNMAIVSYIQANGKANVATGWTSLNDQQRYTLLIPYLSFAPANLTDFIPKGYSATLPGNLNALTKSILTDTSTSSAIAY
ncbi:MAG: type II secretion system protein [Verrucomicrobiales bacterium]|nr:type II secretion system protein [Verrucomicrobiales bacterium]